MKHSWRSDFERIRRFLMLAPLLLGAASYLLEAGRGTSVLYDLEAIERQIEDKLVRGRPRLDANQVG